MEDDSWENWLSHLEASTGGSSISFEEATNLNDNSNNKIAERSSKRGRESNNMELEDEKMRGGGRKKGRRDHIMTERKRRQEMAEKFIALSATIPGLKKIDKASVLQEAINYVKQLKERIAILEKENNNNNNTKCTKSLIIKKSHDDDDDDDDDDDGSCDFDILPEVEARALEKEVLIRVHCEKRKGIMLNLLALLENSHLSVASSSILPFGNSALNIIIIAKMSEEFSLTVNDLVKRLKQHLLEYMKSKCKYGPC